MKVEWCESLASGYETIDTQHKELFEHINTFFESFEKEYKHEVTIRTLNFLVKYVRYHFGSEEELMREHNYPEFKEHLSAHRIIVDKLMECYKDLISSGDSSKVNQEIKTLLQVWFVEHIMGHDIKLASYLNENV